MKETYGDEYPAAVTIKGIRMPLLREGRWARYYRNDETKIFAVISRFMDGTASITREVLEQEWSSWSRRERLEFCQACSSLGKQSDFPDMLRHIMKHGTHDDWRPIASRIARALPQQEAFEFLCAALGTCAPEDSTNLINGIAQTRHPEVVPVLRAYLDRLWAHPVLWENDEFLNWVAQACTSCVECLIEAGVSSDEFVARVEKLSNHVCGGNRDSCRRLLKKHYPWMEDE